MPSPEQCWPRSTGVSASASASTIRRHVPGFGGSFRLWDDVTSPNVTGVSMSKRARKRRDRKKKGANHGKRPTA